VDRRLVIALSALFVAMFFAMLTNMLVAAVSRSRWAAAGSPGCVALASLEAGLAGRDQLGARWDRTPVVLRMFDPQLARSVRHNPGCATLQRVLPSPRPGSPGWPPAKTC
jgi:hypothetical protein